MAYHRPIHLQDALATLATPGIRVLAGATDIFPAVTTPGLAGPILDITAIKELSGIRQTAKAWRIGAATTWSQVATADLPPAFQSLQQAALQIGSPQIQNSATVAGNLCNASPAADGVPPLLVLDALVEIGSSKGTRQVPLGDFIRGVRKTALTPGELVTAIEVPKNATQGGSAFVKLGARKYLVISICMVAARIGLSGDRISGAAISIGACSPVAQRMDSLEQMLVGRPAKPDTWGTDISAHIQAALSPISDIRSDDEYRRSAAAEICRQAIVQAIEAAHLGGTQ